MSLCEERPTLVADEFLGHVLGSAHEVVEDLPARAAVAGALHLGVEGVPGRPEVDQLHTLLVAGEHDVLGLVRGLPVPGLAVSATIEGFLALAAPKSLLEQLFTDLALFEAFFWLHPIIFV